MEKINSFSLCSIVIGLSGAAYWGILSTFVLETSKNDTFISLIIGFILSLIIFKLFVNFFNKKTDLTIIGKNKLVYGKFSYVINIIFIAVSLSLYIFQTYRLTSFLSSQYLINTPKIFLHLLIILTTFYIANKDIETITRVSIISLFLAIVIYMFDAFSLVGYVKIDNYLPILNTSYKNILSSSIVFAAYFSGPSLYINSIKKDQITDKEKFNKVFYALFTLSFILLLLATLITVGNYGIELTNMFDYPLYTVLKKINILSFIDSVENISIMLWILYIINSSNMILYSAINSVKETFNLKNNKYSIIILLLLSVLIPYILFMKNNFVETFDYIIVPFSTIVLEIIIIFITSILIKKKM